MVSTPLRKAITLNWSDKNSWKRFSEWDAPARRDMTWIFETFRHLTLPLKGSLRDEFGYGGWW